MNSIHFRLRRRLQKLAGARGFRGRHRRYRRFILLGEGRSGSNFLRGLLNSHPGIVTYGELFRFPDAIGWEFPEHDRHLQTPRLLARSQRDPAGFLESEVFGYYPPQVGAVGFKIFYYHAQDGARASLWSHLQEDEELAVIHMKRRNLLRGFLSLQKAFKTDRWTNSSGPEPDELSVPLDFEECLDRFARTRNLQEGHDRRFQKHPTLEIVYETLCENVESECGRIQDFLGVPRRALRPSTFKQAAMPLSKAITNYEELKVRFRGTPWEALFDE